MWTSPNTSREFGPRWTKCVRKFQLQLCVYVSTVCVRCVLTTTLPITAQLTWPPCQSCLDSTRWLVVGSVCWPGKVSGSALRTQSGVEIITFNDASAVDSAQRGRQNKGKVCRSQSLMLMDQPFFKQSFGAAFNRTSAGTDKYSARKYNWSCYISVAESPISLLHYHWWNSLLLHFSALCVWF